MQLTKRKLTDLWIVGREVELDDGDGEPVKVWLQKLNSLETQEANRRCDAARARMLLTRDEDSDSWVSALQTVREYAEGSKTKLAEFLANEDKGKLQRRFEAQIAQEEEWAKDNRLQGLRDAWNDTLQRRWLADHDDDPEAAACKAELERFMDQVNAAVDTEMESVVGALTHSSMGELEHRMVRKLIDMEANAAWSQELFACQILFGVRSVDNHRERLFSQRHEVDELSEEAFNRLSVAYQNLEVDVMEGKGSQAAPGSSDSSGLPSEAATETPSGLVDATA